MKLDVVNWYLFTALRTAVLTNIAFRGEPVDLYSFKYVVISQGSLLLFWISQKKTCLVK